MLLGVFCYRSWRKLCGGSCHKFMNDNFAFHKYETNKVVIDL